MTNRFSNLVKKFARDESGASLVEYSILIALVTVAVVAAIGTMGDQILLAFQRMGTVLTTSNAP